MSERKVKQTTQTDTRLLISLMAAHSFHNSRKVVASSILILVFLVLFKIVSVFSPISLWSSITDTGLIAHEVAGSHFEV